MKFYSLRNSEGEYISNTIGEVTNDWLKASKFMHKDIPLYTRYVSPQYKLVCFEVIEVKLDKKF